MTKIEAKNLLGDRAEWELKAMIRALSIMPFFNTDEDNQRLEACKILIK